MLNKETILSNQKFYANPALPFTFNNGAVGYRSSASFDTLGPYAKVRKCPVAGTDLRLTCYATGYADTFFSVPACTQYGRKYISGYFTNEDGVIEFRPMDRHKNRLPIKEQA